MIQYWGELTIVLLVFVWQRTQKLRMKSLFILVLVIAPALCGVISNSSDDGTMAQSLGRQLVEQGRTMVHHAVKRFLIILPAIFFKMGVAFTMLVLVTIVAVNNGFIGFLLLVVGLSSVLARLQQAREHYVAPTPFINPLPPYHHHFIDRSDVGTVKVKPSSSTAAYSGYSGLDNYNHYNYGQYSEKKF